jgi:hypothetical protein
MDSQLHSLNVLNDTKAQARRALLAFAKQELIKAIVKFPINRLKGNHKLTKDEKLN